MATLAELTVDIAEFANNDAYIPRYANWLNNAMVEIARDFELPPLKLIKPIYFWMYSDTWYYPMPAQKQAWASGTVYTAYTPFVEDNPTQEVPPLPHSQPVIGSLIYDAATDAVYQSKTNHTAAGTFAAELTAGKWRKLYSSNVSYHKKVTGARSYENQWEVIPVSYEMAMIENLDSLHHDTGNYAEQIGVEDKFLGVYPRVDDVVSMYFYRMPLPMIKQSDVPDGLDDEFHHDVIVPWVIIRNFKIINQMAIRPLLQNITFWQKELRDGTEKLKLKLAKSKSIDKRGGSDPLP
jgi:hypothetical protein